MPGNSCGVASAAIPSAVGEPSARITSGQPLLNRTPYGRPGLYLGDSMSSFTSGAGLGAGLAVAVRAVPRTLAGARPCVSCDDGDHGAEPDSPAARASPAASVVAVSTAKVLGFMGLAPGTMVLLATR